MRLVDIEKMRGCAIVRPHSQAEIKRIMSCSEVILHSDIPTALDVTRIMQKLGEEREDSYADFELYAEERGIDEDNDFFYEGIKRAIEIIKSNLKTTGTNQSKGDDSEKMIPCNRELPKESDFYLACIYNREVDDYDFRKTWFAHKADYDMDESEWCELQPYETVTAWMPLLEPYKGEDDDWIIRDRIVAAIKILLMIIWLIVILKN